MVQRNTIQGFFSKNLLELDGNISETLFLFSIIDLPFENKNMSTQVDNDILVIKPSTNAIVLTKEIIEEEGKPTDKSVMIQQRFFDCSDKYIYSDENPNIKYEKPVKEFLEGRLYESSVVITNPSSIPIKLQVIHEIPQGSIAIESLDTMNIHPLILKPLQSKIISSQFYFPKAGLFSCYPATAIQNSEILGIAKIAEKLEVKAKKTIIELSSLQDILQSGNIKNIKEFLLTKNLNNHNIFSSSMIIGLMKNKELYQEILPVLRQRCFYDSELWKYSILHADMEGFKEFLADTNNIS